jgi:hypothetical protein
LAQLKIDCLSSFGAVANDSKLAVSTKGYPTTYHRTGVMLHRGLPENAYAKEILAQISRFKYETQSYGCDFEQYMTTLAVKPTENKISKLVSLSTLVHTMAS